MKMRWQGGRVWVVHLCVLLLAAGWLVSAQQEDPPKDPREDPGKDRAAQLSGHVQRGLRARDEERLGDAAREFEAALKLAPNVAQLHASLGLVRHREGKLSLAVASFERALEVKPDLGGVNGLLGFDLLMLGRVETALSDLLALGLPRERVLHVAQSRRADIVPANRIGLSCVWVDRPGHMFGRAGRGAEDARPDWEVSSLADLVDRLE